MKDTSAAAAEIVTSAWRAMSAAERLRAAGELSRTVLVLERAGLLFREPLLDESEVFRRLAVRRLGEELASRAYGPARARR